MDTRRKLFIGLILLGALGGTKAFAATTCPAGAPLSVYLQLGFSCADSNNVTFSMFSYNGPLSSDSISVTENVKPFQSTLQFTGNFTTGQAQSATFIFTYFIDPPPVIHEEQLDLDPLFAVSLQEELCTSSFGLQGNLTCPNANQLPTLTVNTGNTKASTELPLTGTLGVRDTLTINGAGANSQGFDNVTFTTPEPSAILLAVSGLLGLLAFRSRAKLRKMLF